MHQQRRGLPHPAHCGRVPRVGGAGAFAARTRSPSSRHHSNGRWQFRALHDRVDPWARRQSRKNYRTRVRVGFVVRERRLTPGPYQEEVCPIRPTHGCSPRFVMPKPNPKNSFFAMQGGHVVEKEPVFLGEAPARSCGFVVFNEARASCSYPNLVLPDQHGGRGT